MKAGSVNMQLLQMFKNALNKVNSMQKQPSIVGNSSQAKQQFTVHERQLIAARIIQETVLRDAVLKLLGMDPYSTN